MKSRIIKYLIISMCSLFTIQGFAQEYDTYVLWEDGVKESNEITKEEVENKGSVTNVTVPELYVYHPEENLKNGITVIICPGGGYTKLAIEHEGRMFANWLTKRGYTAVLLKYRLPNGHYTIPFSDASRAVRFVRSKADEWGIKADKIGISGFSAGGHLASTALTQFDKANPEVSDKVETYSSRPDFGVLFYPVISLSDSLAHKGSRSNLLGKDMNEDLIKTYSSELNVSADTPPTFLIHSDDDKGVLPMNSVVFYEALKKYNIPSVLYILPSGGHGWGFRPTFEYHDTMSVLLEDWLKKGRCTIYLFFNNTIFST
ncbi:MAG: alpha/beta hydrolase [Odoribacter sp.]|nr:alpha/beta hydrolase [Odoribacter sp.]